MVLYANKRNEQNRYTIGTKPIHNFTIQQIYISLVAYYLEVNNAVVNAVQTDLMAAVVNSHTGHNVVFGIANRHNNGVNTVARAVHNQVSEHSNELAMNCA